MIQTVSKLYVQPGKSIEFIEIFKKMIGPTKKEKGCLQYEMYQDEDNETLFIVLERWKLKEDFDNHLKSAHFEEIVPRMLELLVKESELNVTKFVA